MTIQSQSRRRRRSLISGRVRNVLFTLGLIGLVLGLAMGLFAFLKDNAKIGFIAAAYVMGALLLLLIRKISMLLDAMLRNRRQESDAASSETGSDDLKGRV